LLLCLFGLAFAHRLDCAELLVVLLRGSGLGEGDGIAAGEGVPQGLVELLVQLALLGLVVRLGHGPLLCKGTNGGAARWRRYAQQNGCVSSAPLLDECATRRLRMTDRIEKTVDLTAPVSRVWKALTDHEEFGKWFRVRLDAPFVPGQVSRGRVTYPGYEHLNWEAVVPKMEPDPL